MFKKMVTYLAMIMFFLFNFFPYIGPGAFAASGRYGLGDDTGSGGGSGGHGGFPGGTVSILFKNNTMKLSDLQEDNILVNDIKKGQNLWGLYYPAKLDFSYQNNKAVITYKYLGDKTGTSTENQTVEFDTQHNDYEFLGWKLENSIEGGGLQDITDSYEYTFNNKGHIRIVGVWEKKNNEELHTADFKFVPEDEKEVLPETIVAPAQIKGLTVGEEVTEPEFEKEVRVEGGVWRFKEWDQKLFIAEGSPETVVFKGMWSFTAEYPETGAEIPETGTETPEAGTETPEAGTETPEAGTETPEAGTETPETGTEYPETGTEYPETGTEYPETGTETQVERKVGYSGGGGAVISSYVSEESRIVNDTTEKEHFSAQVENKEELSVSEINDSYSDTDKNGINKFSIIEGSELDQEITRGELAKIISIYATKIGKKELKKSDIPLYSDHDQIKDELKKYVELSYQLQLMGIGANGKQLKKFDPNKLVTMEEFATVISRLLFGEKFNQKGANWYQGHISVFSRTALFKGLVGSFEKRSHILYVLQQIHNIVQLKNLL